MLNIRVGTRGSKLALAQTNTVLKQLTNQDLSSDTVIINTSGDKVLDRDLHQVGSIGLFINELDTSLLNGSIDIAVHSMKDIPTNRPTGLITAAVLHRDTPTDFLVSNISIDEIHTIGTSSMRRRAQLLRYFKSKYPFKVDSLRGNLDTRLLKLKEGKYDAIVVAEAGLERLNYNVSGVRLPYTQFVPSPNQGTIAIVCRKDFKYIDTIKSLNDDQTMFDTTVERIIMEKIGGGCFIPAGIYCQNNRLVAEVLSIDGSKSCRIDERVSSISDAVDIGKQFYESASDIITETRNIIGLR